MLNLRTFNIERLTPTASGSKKMAYVATGKGVEGFLETSSPQFSAMVDGEFGKTFSLFSDDLDADVKNGDRLVDMSDSEEYDVKGVMRTTDGPGRKLQITLTLHIEQ